MQLPLVEPAPVVLEHSMVFRDLFENRKQFQHFQNYVTALMVLDNKTMANISRCILDSADKTNVSRFFSKAKWEQDELNRRRLEYLLEQTDLHRLPAGQSNLVIDDTLCEHVGSVFEHITRHYNHSSNTYPLAHNLVTSFLVSGAVRFPVDAREYRRFEALTQWESFVKKHFPDRDIPSKKKARERLHNEVDPVLLTDPDFKALSDQFQTKITLAGELVEQAIAQQIPFQTVLMDSWFLSPELVRRLARLGKDWVSLLKDNRNLETSSFTVRDAEGRRIPLSGPHIKVKELVEVLPSSAYKPITVRDTTYYGFTKSVRVPSLGRVRILICFENSTLTGPYAVLITNRRDWTATQILQRYLQRWPIETFYQDGKGHLGLAAYRMRSTTAIQKHWCLVFVAYSLVHLACLPPRPLAGTTRFPTRPIKTIGEVCRQQAQSLIQALILYAHDLLQAGESAQDVFQKLFAKQQVLATS